MYNLVKINELLVAVQQEVIAGQRVHGTIITPERSEFLCPIEINAAAVSVDGRGGQLIQQDSGSVFRAVLASQVFAIKRGQVVMKNGRRFLYQQQVEVNIHYTELGIEFSELTACLATITHSLNHTNDFGLVQYIDGELVRIHATIDSANVDHEYVNLVIAVRAECKLDFSQYRYEAIRTTVCGKTVEITGIAMIPKA